MRSRRPPAAVDATRPSVALFSARLALPCVLGVALALTTAGCGAATEAEAPLDARSDAAAPPGDLGQGADAVPPPADAPLADAADLTGLAPDAPDAPDAPAPPPDAAPLPDAAPPPPDAPAGPDARAPDAAAPPPDAALPDLGLAPECADVADLLTVAQAVAGGWRVLGDSSESPALTSGSCAGQGPELVYRFVAPVAGEYHFTTVTDDPALAGFDTVLHLRSRCGDPATELDCNDDASGLLSLVSARLEAGERVFVFADAFGAAGGRFQLSVSTRRAAGEGEPCDPTGALNFCAEGLRCVVVGEGDAAAHACLRVAPPSLITGELGYNAAAPSIGVRVTGSDPNGDVEALLLTLFGADGAALSLGVGVGPLRRSFTSLEQADAAFSGELALVLPPDLPPVARAVVEALDRQSQRSAPLTLEARLPPAVEAGEACDAVGAFGACAEGLLCDDLRCGDPPAACPEAFDVQPLELDQPFPGTLAGAPDLAAGLCGGRQGERAFSFTASVAGLHVFEAAGPDAAAAPLLFARARCAVEDASVELGCALPDAFGAARLAVTLAVDETVYLFVDSAEPEWAGLFTLTAHRPSPPSLESAEVFVNADASMLGFDLRGLDREGDVVAFGLRLLDAAGEDLLGETVELSLAPEEVEAPGAGRVLVRAARLCDFDPGLVALTEISLIDRMGGRSAVRSLMPKATPAVARGEACDALLAFSRCRPEDRCRAPGGGAPACTEVRDDCPEAYGDAIDLAEPGMRWPDGSWRHEGDTTDAANLAAGTCGGNGSSEVVYRFEAPVNGTYLIAALVMDAGRDTLLYVSTSCGEAGEEAELGCNDDNGRDLGSEVSVELDAGEVVYVFVDGFFGGTPNNGPYGLHITVQEDP